MRSYSSLVCGMLGQHPSLFGLPEVNLFAADIWNHMPAADAKAKTKLVKLRAVYEVQPDEESKKLGVCTGKIVSATDTDAIW